ncbi:hypothetical protein CARUB_v10006947mg [Capsella rubella]|uniref:Uncharacterized protein n=1 Tax=Capsella rubella TaxID=81985 RepID=R0GNG6_9BRAS|nr:hypothetical protein CARUB_v10006947mg [Capsella rubella]
MSQFAGNHVGGDDPFDGVPDELRRDDYRQLERGFADDYGGTHAAWRGFSGSEETLGDLTEEDVRNLDGLLPSCSNGGTLVPGEPSTRRGKVFEDVVGSSSRNPHRSIVSGLRASSAVPEDGRVEPTLDDGMANVLDRRDKGKSLSTEKSVFDMFEACGIEPGIEILIPKSRRRPWDAPEGYICVYEDFFSDCGLWFPLPRFLASYCARREIAFSQLTVASIRNAVGLAILAAAAGVVVDLDLFEEFTKYLFGKENPGMCCASSRPGFRIVDGAASKVRRWRKYYFFVKVTELSVEDLSLPYARTWNLDRGKFGPTAEDTEDFRARVAAVKARRTLWWPDILKHFNSCSRSCLRMGDCEIPDYADQFDGDGTQVDEPQIELGPMMLPNASFQCGFGNDAPVGDVDVAVETTDGVAPADDRDAVRRARSEEVKAARDGKKVSRSASGSAPPPSGRGDTSRKRSSRGSPVGGSSVRREARREEPIREIAEGVDHSFSFNYGRRDRMFFTHGGACADLASKVRGDFAEFPAVDSLRGRELYEDWASRSFQAMSQTNRLVARDSDLAKAAAEASDRSAQSHLRNYNSEKSRCADLTRQLKDKKKQYLSETDRLRRARDESAAAERHRVAGEIHEYRTRIDRMGKHIVGLREKKKPLLMLSQVSSMEKCLKKMVINGTHIPLRNLAQVEQDHIQWRATRASRSSAYWPCRLLAIVRDWARLYLYRS